MSNRFNFLKRPLVSNFLLLTLADIIFAFHGIEAALLVLPYFALMPGVLVLKLLDIKINKLSFYYLSAITGLLLFMLEGLVLDFTKSIGLNRPLTTIPILIILNIVTGGLILLARNKLPHLPTKLPKISVKSFLGSFLGALLPLLAIFGAIRLNNGASNILTMIFLFLSGIIVFLILRKTRHINISVLLLYFIACGLLLSISMRGTLITGDDVQREFFFFTKTVTNGYWSIGLFRDTYNACLSVTILPTFFSAITHFSNVNIFKLIFPFASALIVIPIYRIGSIVANKKIGLCSVVLFISFPIFLNDYTSLNRQAIAFLFFAGCLLVNLESKLKRRQRTALTLIMLSGIVFSHYSTLYASLALLLISRILTDIINIYLGRTKKTRIRHDFPMLNYRIIIFTLLMAFMWNAQFTATSQGLTRTLRNTISSVIHGDGAQSADVSYSIFSSDPLVGPELLSKYVDKNGGKSDSVQYVDESNTSLTRIGTAVQSAKINVVSLNDKLKEASSVFLQIGLLAGTAILLWRLLKKSSDQPNAFLAVLCSSGIALLALQSLLPEVSVDYGTLRMFQHMLIFSSIPISIVIYKIFRETYAKFFMFGLFLVLTSFVGQILGGYQPVLQLNNAGRYYDDYYLHQGELYGTSWLSQNHQSNTAIYINLYAQTRFVYYTPQGSANVRQLIFGAPYGYVYLDYADVHTGEYDISIDGTIIHYKINDSFAQKDTIYDDGDSVVYR